MSTAFFVAIAISTATIGPTSNVSYSGITITDGITYPARIAPTPGGGIYVTDPPMKLFAEYSAAGALVGTHTIAEGAVGIAVHTDGRIFISRDDGKIGVYSTAFAFLYTVNPAPLTLTGPNDLAFDTTTNELYTVDSGSHRVLVFMESALGSGIWTLARSWGMEGTEMGQFAAPQAIALNTTLGQVIVTDADNFRIQVFNTTGILLFKFGYRILYLPTTDTAWFARSEGVAVDACNNIYIADALMGTVRVFSSVGKELNSLNLPAIGYGTGAGQLRVPCDVAIDGAGMMYVASTNNGAVEVFNVACAATASSYGPTDESRSARKATPAGRRAADRRTALSPIATVETRMPDNPLEFVRVINNGEYGAEFDFNRDNAVDWADMQIAVDVFGAGTVEDFLNMAEGVASGSHPAFSPPHILDMPNACGRCHSMDGSPGGMLTSGGQENLCQSCHSAGKIAGQEWIGPGTDLSSHPWGVPADDLDPLSDLAQHLDNGNVRCATCHDPHESSPPGRCDLAIGECDGGPFHGSVCKNDTQCAPLVKFMREEIYHGEDHFPSQGGTPVVHARKRMTVMEPTLCGECHVDIVAQWEIVGHAEREADPWSHYDWSMGNNWLCTGPGTPYAHCTGEGAGTATSPATALCTGPLTPLACCTGAGTGTCTISNASCTGVQTPWQCCLGAAPGVVSNCIANTACLSFQNPSPCCTGAGTGTCSNGLPATMCTGAGTPEPCCSGPGAGSCSDRASCRQCHSGNGYRDYSQDYPDGTVVTSTHRGTLRVIDCLVCHATHGESQDGKLLRIYDTVRLPTGQVFTGVGAGATCMACHNGRTVPPTNPSSVSTPHYLNGAAMLEGINAVTTFPTGSGAITYTLSNSNHTTNAGLNCTTCHMAPGPTSGSEVGKVGGHTFRLVDHDAVPLPYENVAACNASGCHSGLTTINRTASGDYDGDGTIEGVQSETRGLLGILKDALYAAGASRLLVNPDTGVAGTEEGVCTGNLTPLACCTGVGTGPTCADPEAEPTNPYWTLRRCSGGTRNGLACNGPTPTAPFDCPGGGTCPQLVPTGNRTTTIINGIWNWEFVDNSGDLGVKNTGYAIGLLQIAYKGAMGFPVPRLDLCTLPATPWACCTGAGTGTCSPITQYRYTPAP